MDNQFFNIHKQSFVYAYKGYKPVTGDRRRWETDLKRNDSGSSFGM